MCIFLWYVMPVLAHTHTYVCAANDRTASAEPRTTVSLRAYQRDNIVVRFRLRYCIICVFDCCWPAALSFALFAFTQQQQQTTTDGWMMTTNVYMVKCITWHVITPAIY